MKKILVIGDTILDKYIFLDTLKISDEAPVITHTINEIKYVLGGGANVSRNVASLGNECDYLGLYNECEIDIKKLFMDSGINAKFYHVKNSIPIKTRIISRSNQICRFDSKNDFCISEKIKKDIYNFIDENLDKYNFIIFSKYFPNFMTNDVIEYVSKKAKNLNIPTLLDNRQNNSLQFSHIDILKVNFNEFCNLLNIKIDDNINDILKSLDDISDSIMYKYVIITRSEKEVIFWERSKKYKIFPIEKSEVLDVSGAGDTFVSTFATFFGRFNCEECINISIKASKISISKLGTSTVHLNELSKLMPNYNLVDDDDFIHDLKNEGKKIVFTNGVFDILHEGHIDLLKFSKEQGDCLIVGINSDKSVQKLKGLKRPIVPQEERKKILESIKYVDYVIIFDELNASNLIKKIKPDIYIKGSDYNIESLPEKNFLNKTKVIFFSKMNNKSTTAIIDKIQNRMNYDD